MEASTPTEKDGQQIRNPLLGLVMSSKQKKRGTRADDKQRYSLERSIDVQTIWQLATTPSSSPQNSAPLSPSSTGAAVPDATIPSSSTVSAQSTHVSPSHSASLPALSLSAPNAQKVSLTIGAASSSNNATKLNKASSWVTRLAGTGELRRTGGDSQPLSPLSPRHGPPGSHLELGSGRGGSSITLGSHQQPAALQSANTSTLRSPLSSPRSREATPSLNVRSQDTGDKVSDEEEEKRKKRFFNNLIFFKDVESTKIGSATAPIEVEPAVDMALSPTVRKEDKKKKSFLETGSGIRAKGGEEENATALLLAELKLKGLRKATSGRQVTETLLKATRTLSVGSASQISVF